MLAQKQQERRLRAANRELIPFAIGLFTGEPAARSQRSGVPLLGRDALTREAVEGLSEVIRRGALRWLCVERGGWLELQYPNPETDDVLCGRVWDTPLRGLRFSHQSLDAVRCGHDLLRCADTRAQRSAARELSALTPRLGGDVLCHHLVLRAAGDGRTGLRPDPLSALSWPEGFEPAQTEAALGQLEALLDSDLGPALPWLLRAATGDWPVPADARWHLDAFERFASARTAALWAMNRLATGHERWDLLAGPMRYFRRVRETLGEQRRRFDQLTARLPYRRRLELGRAWASELDRSGDGVQAYEAARRSHPVDREAAAKVLMSSFHELDYAQVDDEISRVALEIRPRVS